MSNSNTDVINAFLNRKSLRAANLSSDGESLWSYNWWQLATHAPTRTLAPTIIVRNGPAFSQSTACQRAQLHHCLSQRNHVSSESPAPSPITVLQSELTPRSLGHMRIASESARELVNA